MGFKEIMDKLIGGNNDDVFLDDEDLEEEEFEEVTSSYSRRRSGDDEASAFSSKRSSSDYDDDYRSDRETRRYSQRSRRSSAAEPEFDKVVDIHTTAKLQVVLSKPERFDNARDIADNLNEKRTVVLNLDSADEKVARRLVDFLSGVAYANGGQIKKVAANTFIITPYNVDVSGDLIDELETTGIFF